MRGIRCNYSAHAVKILALLHKQSMSAGELFVASRLVYSTVLDALAELTQRGLILQFQSGRYYVNHFDSQRVRPINSTATTGNLTHGDRQ